MTDRAESTFSFRYLEEVGRTDPLFFPPETRGTFLDHRNWSRPRRRLQNRHLILDERQRLILMEESTPTVLAQFCGQRRDMSEGAGILLNGDGFNLTDHTQIQTSLRQRAQRTFGVARTMIIPFAALNSSGVDYDTIRRIHVSGDVREQVRMVVATTLPPFRQEAITAGQADRARARTTSYAYRYLGWRGTWEHRQWEAWWVPQNRTAETGTVQWMVNVRTPNETEATLHDVTVAHQRPSVSYQVHRLGASVFSAVGPDGFPHRFISAFDEQEAGMYYLAQLPDEGKVKNYREAVSLLAPPVVHRAWDQGRTVVRQGDIFAIETQMTDEQLLEADAEIVSRATVLQVSGGGTARINRHVRIVERQKIMLHGTGHTATRVAVLPNGVTFARGTMYHDPMLEAAGRAPEHRNSPLGNNKAWFLIVRNTVPSQYTVEEVETNVRDRERAA